MPILRVLPMIIYRSLSLHLKINLSNAVKFTACEHNLSMILKPEIHSEYIICSTSKNQRITQNGFPLQGNIQQLLWSRKEIVV